MQLNSNVHTSNELLTSHSSSCALLNFVMKKYFATSFLMKKKKNNCAVKEVFGLGFFLFWGTAHYREKEKKEREREKRIHTIDEFIFLQCGINDPH